MAGFADFLSDSLSCAYEKWTLLLMRMDAMANSKALDNYFKLMKEVLEECKVIAQPGNFIMLTQVITKVGQDN